MAIEGDDTVSRDRPSSRQQTSLQSQPDSQTTPTVLPQYGQDLRADAVDAILGLCPKTPSINAFALKAAVTHRHLLQGNAFYQALWNEQQGYDPGQVHPAYTQIGIRDLSTPLASLIVPRPATPSTARSGSFSLHPQTPVSLPATPMSDRSFFPSPEEPPPMPPVRDPPKRPVATTQMAQRPRAQGPRYSPVTGLRIISPTAVHPALRERPALSPIVAADVQALPLVDEDATSTAPNEVKMPVAAHSVKTRNQMASRPPPLRLASAPVKTSSQKLKVDEGLTDEQITCGQAKRPPTTSTASPVSGGSNGKVSSISSRGMTSASLSNTSPGSIRTQAMSDTGTEQKPLPTPPEPPGSTSVSGRSADAKKSETVKLKLIPSPNIAQNAIPTQRALIETHQQEVMQEEVKDEEGDKAYETIAYTPKPKNVEFDVRPVSRQDHLTEPKSPKKTTFFDKIRFGWRGHPPISSTPVPNASSSTINVNDPGGHAILQSQPKAQAVLVGPSNNVSVTRTPSKKTFFARKTATEVPVSKSPRKRLSFGFREGAAKSPSRRRPSEPDLEDMPKCSVIHRSQSLKYLDNSVPPTPPAKNTPPQIRAAKAARMLGLGFGSAVELAQSSKVPRRMTLETIDSSPIITEDGPFGPTRFGTFANKLEIPRLVTKPSSHSLHASVVPELMDGDEFEDVKARFDGLDLHGFSMPNENKRAREDRVGATTPTAVYSPSMYSQDMGLSADSPFTPFGSATLPKNSVRAARSYGQLLATSKSSTSEKSKARKVSPVPEIADDESQRERAASVGTVTIAYPELSSDPSINDFLRPHQGEPDAAGLPKIAVDPAKDTEESEEAFTARGLSCYDQYFPIASRLPHKLKGDPIATPDERPKWVLSPEHVGRGAIFGIDGNGQSSNGEIHPLDSAVDLGQENDTPRSIHPELFPPPLQFHHPTLPITTFLEPPTPSRAERSRPNNGLKSGIAQSDLAPDLRINVGVTESLPEAESPPSPAPQDPRDTGEHLTEKDIPAPASFDDMLKALAKRNRSVQDIIKLVEENSKPSQNSESASSGTDTFGQKTLPKTRYERKTTPRRTTEAKQRVTTNVAHEFYRDDSGSPAPTVKSSSAQEDMAQPKERRSSAGRRGSGPSNIVTATPSRPRKHSASASAKANGVTNASVAAAVMGSPALGSSPEVLPARFLKQKQPLSLHDSPTHRTNAGRRKHRAASAEAATSVLSASKGASQKPTAPLVAPLPTLEESLAKNRDYQEQIAQLTRRLEVVESRMGTSGTSSAPKT